MNIIKRIIGKSWYMLMFLVILGLFNGMLTSGVLVFINNTIIHKPLPYFPKYDWLIFAGLLLTTLLCTKVFQMQMIKLTNNLLFQFELEILNKLKNASFQDFEKLGNENVYTAIEDNRILGHIPEIFMNAFNAIVIVFCCFFYLFWISLIGGIIVLALIVLLLTFYIIRNKMIEGNLKKQRHLQNIYYKYLNDLLLGFRELKMSVFRNTNIYEKYLIRNRDESIKISVSNSIKYLDNELTGTYSWYLILGVIMFVLPRYFDLNSEKTTAFLVTILYLIGQIAILITLIPTYIAVKVSNGRLNTFNDKIGFIEHKNKTSVSVFDNEEFESIRFESVAFDYQDFTKGKSFALEPINLEIKKGEVIFVIGGNGSGKSTFGYLLTGLYRPTSGNIYFNNKKISSEDYSCFSDKMSAIFTNNHLFSENYDEMDLRSSNSEFLALIKLMDLNDIIRFNDNGNNLDKAYSKGQQKRLALIYSLLENKSLIILDEWAAEQDPVFRRYFYNEVLPILRKQGKTIVAITHDDEHYSCASRIIKFDYGKIISDRVNELNATEF